jgi:hypothetical protein
MSTFRTEIKIAIERLQKAGYTVTERSCFLDCQKGEIRYPLDITANTVNRGKLNYLIFIA